MAKLHPTLWRTCRVIAGEQRLRLLWLLFKAGEASVGELARLIGMSPPNASIQLRALQARGLISMRRQRQFVFYFPEANPAVVHAPELLSMLSECHDEHVAFEEIIRAATGFTHPRRIEIVKAVSAIPGGVCGDRLSVVTGIPVMSLDRHLKKLLARDYVRLVGKNRFVPGVPQGVPAGLLLRLACGESGST